MNRFFEGFEFVFYALKEVFVDVGCVFLDPMFYGILVAVLIVVGILIAILVFVKRAMD